VTHPRSALLAAAKHLLRGLALAVLLGGLAAAATPPSAAQRWARLTEISFQHLTQDNGLPNAIATAVAEDGDGFIWVGTLGGVARWDGYRFRVYRSDPRTPGALPDNTIQTLHGDAAGRLWIGTSAAGLVRYDRDADRFVTITAGPDGLSHVSVRSIADDGRGGLWVATDGGLDHLDPGTGAVRRSAPDSGDAAGLPSERVRVLLRDHQGRLWAGTQGGLFRRDAGAARFVAVPLGSRRAGAPPEPQSLAEDSGGRVWVGTLQHGAWVIEADGSAASPLQESAPAAGPALQIQQIVGIVETQPGEVWLGTVGQGIVSVDVATRQTRRISHRPTLPLSLADNAVRGLHRDRSGLVWVASNRGVSRHDPHQSAVLTMFGAPAQDPAAAPTSTEVSWILPTADGRLWLGTHKSGVDIIDPSGARVAALRPDAARPGTALPQDIVLALERAGDGSVFIGTKRGLYRASADGRRVARVSVGQRDPSASTWALLADGDTLWIGGQTDGLWKLDLRRGGAVPVLRDAAQALTDQRIIVLARAAAGGLWIGTRYGLNHYDPARGAVTRIVPQPGRPDGLSAAFVTALFNDRQGRLWVGTYGGGIDILQGSAAQPSFRHLSTARGLPDDNVNALLEDGQGRIWVSTDNGLAMVDPATLATRALRRAEGVVFPTYWTGSAARTPEGELLFGGAGGMTIVRPDRLQAWDYRPPVVVTEIRVDGKPLPAGPYAGGSARPLPPLTMPAGANSLAVEFSAIDYSAPERNRYAYRLDGFESTWVETDATRRLAAYTNLPPGDYRLLLRGSNRDGAWTESVAALPVHVPSAWHQTLWFRSVAVLAVLAALFAIVQARTRLLRARQSELERKVSERTAELEEMSRALKEKSRVLERSSITDPLTGLHNRRFLTEHIDTEIAASLRRAQDGRGAAAPAPAPVDTDNVFFVIDVDHFKRVNDVHGHAAGDTVLVQFALRLQSVMRESDYLVRWGGEEFLAVARNTDRARAEELAERIRAVAADTPFVLDDGRTLTVSCSVGFACAPFIVGQPRVLSWQDVVKLADLALLAAKRGGRNAWVGLYAGDISLPAESLLAQAQADLLQAAQDGIVRMAGNKAPVLSGAAAS